MWLIFIIIELFYPGRGEGGAKLYLRIRSWIDIKIPKTVHVIDFLNKIFPSKKFFC